MHEFSGIGSKVAAWKDVVPVAKARGANPVKWLREGWNELGNFSAPHYATLSKSKGWLGTGDITRHFPVGPKSLMLGFGAMTAPGAFAEEDPSGEGLSRARRIGGWLGSNALGIAATVPANVGLLPTLALGIGGTMLGERIGRGIGGAFESKSPAQ